MTSLTSFGQEGPSSGRRETDLTLAARSSWLLGTGEPDREPLQYYGRQPSYLSGLHAAWGTAVALLHAQTTGEGQWVDVSMLEATMMTFDQGLLAAAYFPTRVNRRTGGNILRFPPYILPCADGYVSMLVTDLQWPRFCRMAGETELANDPSLATQDKRLARFDELEVTFIPWFLSHTKQEVFDIAQQFGVPIAPFNEVNELLADPQFEARGFFETVVHPVLGEVKIPGRRAVMSATPYEIRRPAPLLNQHAEEILEGELGYSKEELAALAREAA
jgi:crotonobetainyl-CoA:carnitine CoA-transferase CaiB-like acyl-CoA transferase